MNPGHPGDHHDDFLPADWAALAPLVDQVLDALPEQRAAVLIGVSGGDPERRAMLERLVADCEADVPLLNRPAAARFPELAGDDEVALPDVIGDRYRMGPEVGRGGMARVFRARDLKHDRDVAIKVVRAELAASLGRDRFLREIAIAARLRHPNILPLYDSGDANGALYFVMPFEGGASLRDRVARGGALSIPEALSVLRDVARALQYAHTQGVVHRDIKPDNVLMSGGAAVVADFGIAKAFTAAQTHASDGGAMTQAGTGIGTPAYMAPEQAVGDPATDHRADLYSFGCLAYELLAGVPPFQGLSAHQLITAHVSTTPRPLVELRPDVPSGIARIVARCLEKLPSARPQDAADILAALEAPGLVETPRRPVSFARLIAIAAVVAVAAGIAGVVWWQGRGSGPPITVSVLPNVNIAGDSSLDLFADGLSDEVATALARVPGIQIHGRSGARLYRGQLGIDVKEVGQRLNADVVVTGAMRSLNGRWLISTELTRTSDAAELWSETFDRSPAQQAGVALDIATAIAQALRQRFPNSLGVAATLADNQQTTNPEAYRLFILGQERLRRREQSILGSVNAFRQAIALDPGYAGPHAGLSLALVLTPYFEHGRTAADVRGEVLASAARALELDSTLALPHVAQGMAYENGREWRRAEAEFQTALLLEPDNAEALLQYGRFLLATGRLTGALEQFQAARNRDPASAVALSHVASAYHWLGVRDSARVISEQAVQTGAQNLTTRTQGALIRLGDGRRAEALQLVTGMTTPSPMTYYIRGAVGDTATAMASLRGLESARPRSQVAESARAYLMLALNDTAEALSALERATKAGEIWHMMPSPSSSIFDSIRKSPRFAAILQELDLPAR